ncbi:unnamed protein product, partial [Effrenium voratum]
MAWGQQHGRLMNKRIEFDPIEPLATITRERCRYLQVYAELDGAWQTRADLLDGADILFYDRGWTGTSLPFTQQDVSFVDTDLRCGFLGGAVRFALPSTADPTALRLGLAALKGPSLAGVMPQPAKAGWTFKRKVGWAATRVLPIPEPKVLSGEGSLSQLAEVLLQLGVSKPLLVTDALLVRLGCAKLCTDGLDAAGIRYTVFDQDCAKAIGALIANPDKDLLDMDGMLQVTWYGVTGRKLPPMVAIPTTAGTGSETTVAAVISLPEAKKKIMLADPGLVPQVAILDPQVLKSCPSRIMAATGVDALTHAIESFVSVWATEDTTKKSLMAAQRILSNIELACQPSRDDADVSAARVEMQRGSFEAGTAFTRVSVGYVHAIAHQLGGVFHTPHGEANAMLLATVLEYYIRDEVTEEDLRVLQEPGSVRARASKAGQTPSDGPCPCCAKLSELARAAGIANHYETYSPAMQRRLAILLVRHIRLLVASLGLPLQVPEMKAGDVRPLAERALAEAHGTNQAAGVRWVLDLGYPVPKYMTLRECEEVIATLLPDAEREVWSMKYWRVYFSDDLQGSNPSTEFQLPMSFSNSVTLPGDYQHGTRTVLNIAGVNDDIELTMRIPFQDDCGGVPEVVFTSLSFDDQDPGQELISGTVHVDLPLQYSDQYTALRLYLAYDGSGLGRTQIGAALAPFEFQFTVAAGTRLDSRDYLLVYAENAYGEQPLPVSLLVKDYVLWPEAPGESSVVQSIQFQDEDNIYGKLDGLVKWVPGSMT